VSAIVPADRIETEHRAQALAWLAGTPDIHRRVKPTPPAEHLMSHLVVIDPADGASLLVAHLDAGPWAPAGGPVEQDEHPAEAARRQAFEQLGIAADFADPCRRPGFVSMTRTLGHDRSRGHGDTDVCLWFLLIGDRATPMRVRSPDVSEVRWWSAEDVEAAGPGVLDPSYHRFHAKLTRRLGRQFSRGSWPGAPGRR
jgi:8-oxo-dGTP diphosphatase